MMEALDEYKTISQPVRGIYKEKGSKFLALAAPVSNVEEAIQIVEQMRRENPKARHHCFAYRIGPDRSIFRFNDDGEPSGTAGKPILGQIDSFELSNVVVVVSRYFGGKLLGASGLASAYKLSAQDALAQSSVRIVERRIYYQVTFSYDIMGALMEALNRFRAPMEDHNFETLTPELVFSLPLSHPPVLIDQIIAGALGIYPEEVDGKRSFDRITIRVSGSD